MASPSEIRGDLIIHGSLAVGGGVSLAPGSLGGTEHGIADPVETSKVDHRFVGVASQDPGSAVVADSFVQLHLARNSGSIDGVTAKVDTAPTGGDLAFQLDVQKAASGSNSYATILSAPIEFTQADTDGAVKTATLSTLTFNADDNFIAVVTVSGTTGTQGEGFSLSAILDEES